MEAIRISCAGYPSRKMFDEFVSRFGILGPEVLKGRYFSHIFVSLNDVLIVHYSFGILSFNFFIRLAFTFG